jgi:hypothetical protein
MAKVREIVHKKVDLHACISSACSSLCNRGFGIVHAGHIEALLGEINGVRPDTAPQVNGAAWLDAPTLHQRYEFLPRADVPGCPETPNWRTPRSPSCQDHIVRRTCFTSFLPRYFPAVMCFSYRTRELPKDTHIVTPISVGSCYQERMKAKSPVVH